ncbi:MAG: succinate dehydrogenase/fumarate reductase iron-sulfur subunit [Planctomycetota bacterium]
MRITLKVWRQDGADDAGRMETYHLGDVSAHMSFLEMLDVLNEQLTATGQEPVAFDHDCREGICGSCALMIDGQAHGPQPGTTVCQLHMRHYSDGDTIHVEPWRANAFPVLKDLVVDRTAFDRIQAAGGYISVNTGSPPDANAIPVSTGEANSAMDAASCIACGACVAACPNASAMLYVGARVAHLGQLPQGAPERQRRALRMLAQADQEGFGACSNVYECEAACPKDISVENIAFLNREYLKASFSARE